MKKLKYVGPGYVPGVPAQDFECDDDKLADELIKGGAYKLATEKDAEKGATG